MSPFNFKMWIQCPLVNISQKSKFGKRTYDFWFRCISFCSAVQYDHAGVKLSYHSFKLEVCNGHISTKPQCSNSSFSLTAQFGWTLFLCWYPLTKPVCALKGNMKFLNFHLTAGHQEQWGIQCLPSISRISLAEPKQSWGLLSPAYL